MARKSPITAIGRASNFLRETGRILMEDPSIVVPVEPMTSGTPPPLPKEFEAFVDKPYGGLFGNTVLANVVEELVASPSVIYRPKDLEELTGRAEGSIRSALATLLRLNLIENLSPDDAQHPRYRVNTGSKKFVALSLLAYAMLDDRDGSDCMDMAVHNYYSNYVREKFEPLVVARDVRQLINEYYRSGTQAEPISSTVTRVLA